MNKTNHKLPYEAPQVEVFEYVVEQGFAQSPKATQLETFSEITDESEPGGQAGENYHGEWY